MSGISLPPELRVAVAGDYLKDAATRLREPLLLEDSGLIRFNLSPPGEQAKPRPGFSLDISAPRAAADSPTLT
jgi:hypothetical protein